MPELYKKINQAYINADLEANKKIVRSQFRFVRQNQEKDKQPTILEDITVFNVDKLFEELRADIQNVIDNYINNKKISNTGKLVFNYNILVNYIDKFINKNTISQKDKARIQDKFDELKDMLKQVVDIAVKMDFSDKSQVENIYRNISDYFYQPVVASKEQIKKFSELIKNTNRPEPLDLVARINNLFSEIFTRKFINKLTLKQQKDLRSKFEEFQNKVMRAEKTGDLGKLVYQNYFNELYGELYTLYDELYPIADDERGTFDNFEDGIKNLPKLGLSIYEGAEEAIKEKYEQLVAEYRKDIKQPRGVISNKKKKELEETARNYMFNYLDKLETLPEGIRQVGEEPEIRKVKGKEEEERRIMREEREKIPQKIQEKYNQLEAEYREETGNMGVLSKREINKLKKEARDYVLGIYKREEEARNLLDEAFIEDEEEETKLGEGKPKKTKKLKKKTVKKKTTKAKKPQIKINKIMQEIFETSREKPDIIVEVHKDNEFNPFEILGKGKQTKMKQKR